MSKQLVKLTPDAARVLEEVNRLQSCSLQKLSEETGFELGKVSSLVELLSNQGLIEKTVDEKEILTLTERGKEALEKGLVERRIAQYLIKHNNFHMSKATETLGLSKPDLSAGIGVLKKSGIINIEKGTVSLKDKTSAEMISNDLQHALELIDKGQEVSEELGKALLSRGLVERQSRNFVEVHAVSEINYEVKVEEEVSKITPQLIISGKWKEVKFKPYNIKSQPRTLHPGKYHPYRHFHDHLREKLIALGFKEMKGPLVEQEFWNFDSLFAPKDHPAREDSDIFLIDSPTHGVLPKENFVGNVKATHEDGWITGSKGYKYRWDPKKAARLLLRPQGTAISARTLRKVNPPEKYFSIAKCFRPDDIDATHGVEFYQVEGIVCDPSITFRDLLGILKIFAEDIAGATEVNFRPDYYPFTSPSVELSAKHPVLGRIEFGGAGIFRPEVVRPYGIDYPVIAWGLGIDRLFMVKNQINDIRELLSQDLDWLRKVEVSSGIEVE